MAGKSFSLFFKYDKKHLGKDVLVCLKNYVYESLIQEDNILNVVAFFLFVVSDMYLNK